MSLLLSQPAAALGSYRILDLNFSLKEALKILRFDVCIQRKKPLDTVREAGNPKLPSLSCRSCWKRRWVQGDHLGLFML